MDDLTKLGLTEYEAKAYLTLVKAGSLTATEASKQSHVPHGKIYQTLYGLEEKGLVSSTPIRPKVFKALEPESALKGYVNSRVTEFQGTADSIIPQLTLLRHQKETETTSERVEVIYGWRRQWAFVEHFYNTTQESMKNMFSYEVRPKNVGKALYDCIGRGVEVKLLATKKTKKGIKLMREDLKQGAEVRYYPVEELRLAIKDHREARQQIVNPKNLEDRITVHIQSTELARALEHYFDVIWGKAEVI